MTGKESGRTFVRYGDGRQYEVAYRVRLLKDVFLIDGDPGEIAYHAGEVIIMNGFDTVHALSLGYGEVVGDIVDGMRSLPMQLNGR